MLRKKYSVVLRSNYGFITENNHNNNNTHFNPRFSIYTFLGQLYGSGKLNKFFFLIRIYSTNFASLIKIGWK